MVPRARTTKRNPLLTPDFGREGEEKKTIGTPSEKRGRNEVRRPRHEEQCHETSRSFGKNAEAGGRRGLRKFCHSRGKNDESHGSSQKQTKGKTTGEERGGVPDKLGRGEHEVS